MDSVQLGKPVFVKENCSKTQVSSPGPSPIQGALEKDQFGSKMPDAAGVTDG